jgi:hypothetical protein
MTYVNGVRATPDEPFPLLSKAMEPQSRNGNTRDERINKPKKKKQLRCSVGRRLRRTLTIPEEKEEERISGRNKLVSVVFLDNMDKHSASERKRGASSKSINSPES